MNSMPIQRNGANQRGFTLTEVLVAVAVFAVIFIAALAVYDQSNKVFKSGVESSNLQQNTRVAFDKLVADLRSAGYDFDRDGIPTATSGNAYQQPDEQFEYIGPSAITVRGNYDFETEKTPCGGTVTDNCDNGRERTLENTQFPVVTTGNDEIVTYALVPDSQTTIPSCDTATNCIEFFADTSNPRKSFPDAGAGGVDEKTVHIPGVDLCTNGCNNPPYTLYRFTLQRDQTDFSGGDHINRVPLASNIRSMSFTYYQDAEGQDPLKDVNNTNDVSTGATVGGAGQWTVANPVGLVANRSVRAKINSVRVVLVGMNENPDGQYTDTAETSTIAAMKNYRKYRLETLVAPRNIQKRGMREQDTMPPGPPAITSICTGRCGIVYITWDAPVANTSYGAPDQYKIIYDVSTAPGFLYETTTFSNTFGYVTGLTPNVTYKFAVVALNSYGSSTSATQTATPLNNTKPAAPNLTAVSTGLTNKVTLTFTRPTTDASGSVTCGPSPMPAAEIYGYRVQRTTDLSGASGWATIIPETSLQSTADTVTVDDTTAVNCVSYVYRVSAVEVCNQNAAYNVGNDATKGISVPSNTRTGQSTSGVAPAAVADLTVDQSSLCLAGICQVSMTFPKVLTDVNGAAINVGQYNIYRRLQGATTWPAPVGTVTTIPAGNTITYVDANVNIATGQQYQYKVTAVQCGFEGGDSPVRPYPCPFPAGIINATPVSANSFDGSGTSSNPWLVSGDPVITVNIDDPSRVSLVRGRVYDSGGTLRYTLTAGSAPYQFTWAITPVGTVNRIDINVIETAGCVKSYTYYVEEMGQNCCLTNKTTDATVISYTSGSKFVDIILKNVCFEQLTVNGMSFTLNCNLVANNSKIDHIDFPASVGGCADTTYATNCAVYTMSGGGLNLPNSGSFTFTIPNASNGSAIMPATRSVVTANQTNYKVRVVFNNTLTNPTQPFTGITVGYQRPADLTNQSCTVVP